MSLLLEALKKAEKAKEEAQRRGNAEPASADAAASAPPAASAERKDLVTRDKLPDISPSLEIVSDDLAASRPAAEEAALELVEPAAKPAEPPRAEPGATTPRRGALPADEAGRAAAKKVFEAKFREPNPRMPFYIAVGVLGLFAVGTVIYFWYQLRPPSALVNLNPERSTEVTMAEAAPQPSAASVATPASAPTREPPIPGLPGMAPDAPGAAAPPRPAVPAARSATPAVPAMTPAPSARAMPREAQVLPREEPRLAPRPAAPAPAPQATIARPAPEVNPNVQSGYAAYLAGDLGKSRTDYEEALREDPGNRDAALGLAALDVRVGRYEGAEALYLRLLQADPRDPEAQAALLALRAGRSDPLATESRVKSLLAVDPEAHALNFTLGNQYAQQNRWAEAQREYLKAYAAEPDNADFAYNVAVSFDHLHQTRQALDYYQRALDLARSRGASFDLAAAQARIARLSR
jgi:tetratricopeptide (TPR) repeat protein